MNSVFKIGFRVTSLDCYNLELIIVEHLIAAIGGRGKKAACPSV